MEILEMVIRYAILPLLSVICTVGWALYKKHDMRLDTLENRQNDIEKVVIEIKTEFKYISRDIKEIKELLKSISNH